MSKPTVFHLEGNARKFSLGGNGTISRYTMAISCYDLMIGSLETFYPKNLVYGNGIEPKFHEVNPRVPFFKKGVLQNNVVTRAIWDTLESSPDSMIQNNLGIIINAKKVTLQKKADTVSSVTIELTDESKHGIFNGAHTYATIRDYYLTALKAETETKEEMINKLKLASVWMYIDEGYEDTNLIADKSEGLSTSRQVELYSLYNYRGYFDPIKEAIKGKDYENKIKFYEGDESDEDNNETISIRNILVYLLSFDKKIKKPQLLWGSNGTAITKYGSKLSPNKSAEKSLEYMKKEESFFYSSIAFLPEFLELLDNIRLAIVNIKKYADIGANGTSLRGGSITFPFSGHATVVGKNLPNCLVAPVFCAFKENVDSTSETFKWILPVDTVFSGVINKLIEKPMTKYRVSGGSDRLAPHEILRDAGLYSDCASLVEGFISGKIRK